MNKTYLRINQEDNSTKKEIILSRLQMFMGTTQYHRYSPSLFPHFLLTDGVHYLAESCGAYWLMDLIASYQQHDKIKKHRKLEQYQFWSFSKNKG